MTKTIRILTGMLALVAQTTWAQTQTTTDLYRLFPVLECPAVGDEYDKMISKLEAIKSSIKKDANCSNVELRVKSLEDLIVKDRQTVLELLEQNKETGLSAEQSAQVRKYAEEVTKKVAALNDLFMQSNFCFREDEADKQLSAMAGFVSEASQLVGTLSGPYGAPIALAGNVIAGFLTGLDQVLKSRVGYDFSKRDQWMNYVQNLCTYHSYRQQIDHLLNPSAKISQLQSLKGRLDNQIHMMTQRCTECRAIESQYNASRDRASTPVLMNLQTQARAADQMFSKPYGTYTLQSLGLRDWVNTEITRVQKEANSYWSDVSGRHLLARAKEQIEEFLIQREAPRFLAYQATQAVRDFNTFQQFQNQEGVQIYTQLYGADNAIFPQPLRYPGWSNPVDVFRVLVIQPIQWSRLPLNKPENEDMKFAWTHYRDQSLNRLRNAQTTAAVAQSFCSFFRHSGQYSPAIRGRCTSRQLRALVEEQSVLERELLAARVQSHPVVMPALIESEADLNKYSKNKLEALSRTIEFRILEP